MSRHQGGQTEAAAAHLERILRLIGSPAYPPDPERLRRQATAVKNIFESQMWIVEAVREDYTHRLRSLIARRN